MTLPLEWLDPRVGYQMNRPVQPIWDGNVAVGLSSAYTEFFLENVPFSELDKLILENCGDQALLRSLPEGCYGYYAMEWDRFYGSPQLLWTRLYLSQALAGEYSQAIMERQRARQEAH